MEDTTYTKHEFLELAMKAAQEESKKGKTIHVIASNNEFYADESGLIRNWETLHATFENGEQIDN